MKLDLYAAPGKNGRAGIAGPTEGVDFAAGDPVRRLVDWCARRQNRLAAWIGSGARSIHDYYLKLEDRIDPTERVLKAMASADEFIVHTVVPAEFYRLLRRHAWKHAFWFSVDLLVSAVVIIFTPVLAPLPGPNVFFYYPLLRLLSHYRAIRGTLAGLRSKNIEFRA